MTTAQFDEIFSGHGYGGISIFCHCGRTHFHDDPNAGDWEPGELQKLCKYALEKDSKYIAHRDGVSAADIDGLVIVWGCECGWLERFEKLIWQERERIMKYFSLRYRTETAVLNRVGDHIRDVEDAARLAESCKR